jgi:hypothetical protein
MVCVTFLSVSIQYVCHSEVVVFPWRHVMKRTWYQGYSAQSRDNTHRYEQYLQREIVIWDLLLPCHQRFSVVIEYQLSLWTMFRENLYVFSQQMQDMVLIYWHACRNSMEARHLCQQSLPQRLTSTLPNICQNRSSGARYRKTGACYCNLLKTVILTDTKPKGYLCTTVNKNPLAVPEGQQLRKMYCSDWSSGFLPFYHPDHVSIFG